MRRKIELYIGSNRADLDDQALVLFNYAFTDLENPTAVKNSYSKQVTLPGTATNASIFGHIGRADRRTGAGFRAGAKTPFRIFDELGRILERGYLRLDSVERDGDLVKGYKVSLFGGLGSFFYTLSYNYDGSKRTLADLDYPVQLQEFAITAAKVKEAWARIASHSQNDGIEQMWDVLNFAPAYNGVPSSDFAPKKAIADPEDIGVPRTRTDDGDTYQDKDGLCLVNLAKDQDEWAVKDLRCYLQRPVLSMRAFLEAVAETSEREGFTLDYSAVPAWVYCNRWKTLPTIPSLGSFRQQSGGAEITYSQEQLDGAYIAELDFDGSLPPAAVVNAKISAGIQWDCYSSGLNYTPVTTLNRNERRYRLLIFTQMVAMNGNTMIGGSDVRVFCDWTDRSGQGLADAVEFEPWMAASFENPRAITISKPSTYKYKVDQVQQYEVQSLTPTTYRLYYACYRLEDVVYGMEESILRYDRTGLGAIDASSAAIGEGDWYDLYSGHGEGQYTSPNAPRSGALIDPFQLLQSAYTPAEYLTSFCKMHGLVFKYDPGAQKVTITPRQSFFGGYPVDLSARIDRSKAITIKPLNLTSKWYEMRGKAAEGAFASEYANTYGQDYGIQRVDTGYDFDAEAVDIMKQVVFKNAAAVLDHSAYWNIIGEDGDYRPSILVDKGNTYTLWTSAGKTKEFQVPCPLASATIDYYNDAFPGYDKPGAPKLEFRDAEGKALDGADVLCEFIGSKAYSCVAVTDDTSAMLALNEGTPCWDLTKPAAQTTTLPVFSRYNDYVDDGAIDTSLDYGIPREIAIPDAVFDKTEGSLYLRFWRAYLSDLLHQDTKVMKCRVDFRGMEVGQGLLGRFYYYEGALWVLNKITNYSLTTWDPVECEFVQVQNIDNYRSGQIFI